MKKYGKRFIAVAVVLIISLCFLFSKNKVEVTIVNLNNHNIKDIKKVGRKLKWKYYDAFAFSGTKLISITYQGSNANAENEIARENNAEEAIIMTFVFKTNSKQSKTFNRNSEYTYIAYFIKKNGFWTLKDWGQG